MLSVLFWIPAPGTRPACGSSQIFVRRMHGWVDGSQAEVEVRRHLGRTWRLPGPLWGLPWDSGGCPPPPPPRWALAELNPATTILLLPHAHATHTAFLLTQTHTLLPLHTQSPPFPQSPSPSIHSCIHTHTHYKNYFIVFTLFDLHNSLLFWWIWERTMIFLGLSWGLNELIYGKCLDPCLENGRPSNISFVILKALRGEVTPPRSHSWEVWEWKGLISGFLTLQPVPFLLHLVVVPTEFSPIFLSHPGQWVWLSQSWAL